jgi:EAL domain-containing protein (putative c-di-GMP-specific phosphodiesterase class I)
MTVKLLRSACEQAVKWAAPGKGGESLVISVNVSAVHLAQKGLVDQLREILSETGIEPGRLKLEITESAVMQNAEQIVDVLRKIKELGVRISIDDFGTGYSSLSYLHRFPIDTLKIDRSFVSTMEDGTENGEIVRTVIALAQALKLNVIAEGIESVHQFHQLRILGCEYGQGFLFSRPVSATDAEKLLADEGRWRNILPPNEFGVVARNLEYTTLRVQ